MITLRDPPDFHSEKAARGISRLRHKHEEITALVRIVIWTDRERGGAVRIGVVGVTTTHCLLQTTASQRIFQAELSFIERSRRYVLLTQKLIHAIIQSVTQELPPLALF